MDNKKIKGEQSTRDINKKEASSIDDIISIEREFFNASKLRIGINSDKITLGLGASILIWEKYNLLWDYSLDPGIMEEGISHNFSWRIEL